MPNSWLPQVEGLYFSSPFCKFHTYFSTANWGILNEYNVNHQNRVKLINHPKVALLLEAKQSNASPDCRTQLDENPTKWGLQS